MATEFRVLPYSFIDKRIKVAGPVDFFIDNDDVDVCAVEAAIPILIETLNTHFDFSKFEENRNELAKERYKDDEDG